MSRGSSKRELRKPLVDVLLVPHRKDDFDAHGMNAAFVERLAFVGDITAPPAGNAHLYNRTGIGIRAASSRKTAGFHDNVMN